MTTTLINALYGSLAGQMGLRKSRLESLCVLVVAVLVSRTVNLSHLSGSFPSRAEIASNYRRLQRFFEQVCLDYGTLARVIVRVSGLGRGPWLLALDRTSWKLGRRDVNILTLAVVRDGIAVPILWTVMTRAGNSTGDQRGALLSRFCEIFGSASIAGLIADREFSGSGWMRFLTKHEIPFILRIKEDFHVRLADGRRCKVKSLFQKLGKGGRRYIRDQAILGLRAKDRGPAVKLAATRLASGELLVVATNTEPKTALANYKSRWAIETLFAACKSRGFNLEDSHLLHAERIAKLMAVLAMAFAFAFATGQWRAKYRQITIKVHRRKAQSLFRYGYDLLRRVLLLDNAVAIYLWHAFNTGRHAQIPPLERLPTQAALSKSRVPCALRQARIDLHRNGETCRNPTLATIL